jgi:hypothetical protein
MSALLVSSRNLSFYSDCYYNRYFILSGDSAGLLKNEEDIFDSNKLQPGVQQLMDSIFGQDSDTVPAKRSVRESSANLISTPIANNLPAPILTTNEFATASLENNEKESPTINSSRHDDALSIGRQLYIEYFILIIILIFFYVLVGSAIVRKYDVEGIPSSNLPEPGDDGAPG